MGYAIRRPSNRKSASRALFRWRQVFLLYGQAGYRRIERRCLERVINSQEDVILTVGGGIVSEPETYNLAT
jgi:XRE family transcriptional regulator, aerobic/anaerobic benzoate catabolism transcriptional regulator